MNSHKTLYGKARSVFGCRVKRVWFQLNPFLERTKVKDDEHGVYQPSSKFVLPLQSIVLCEDLNSEKSPDWKELSPDSFWDYLYSSSWGEECSLRVMEGELLELLLSSLFTLERDQHVVSHNTFAYTTNTRPKPTCFKESNEDGHSIIDETLLIDFTYFGKRTHEMDVDFSGSTAYPFSLSSSWGLTHSDYTSASLDSSEGASTFLKHPPFPTAKNSETTEPKDREFIVRSPKSVKFDTASIKIVDSGLLGIKGPLRAIPVTALANSSPFDSSGAMLIKSFIRESSQLLAKKKHSSHHTRDKSGDNDRGSPTMNTRARRGSIQQGKMPTLFEGRGKRANPSATPDTSQGHGNSQASESNVENSDSSESSLPLLEFNLAKLPCSERTKAGLQNWQLDKFAYIRRPPGNEYYLRLEDAGSEFMTAREKLLQKRNVMQAAREEQKKEIEEIKKFFEKKPPKPVECKEDDKPMKPVVKYFDHAPSFTEFLQWLEEENKFDPRYKKHKQRRKKIVKKYKLRTSEMQLSHMESSTITKTSRSSVRRSSLGTSGTSYDESSSYGYPTSTKESSTRQIGQRRMTIAGADLIRFAEEAGGVTDSPAVKHTIIANGRQTSSESEEEVAPLGQHTVVRPPPRQRRWSIGVETNTSQFVEEQKTKLKELKEKPSGTSRASLSLGQKASSSGLGNTGSSQKIASSGSGSKSGVSLFRKNEFKIPGRELDLDTESADTESEEEDELEDSLFDSNKLNKRYSFEKLRGKNYHKKKPIFFDILKKYYRVQKAMTALRGPAKKSSMSTAAGQRQPAGRSKPGANFLRRLSHRPIKPKQEIILGKIKAFGFQQFNNHKSKVPEVILPDFYTYPMKEFVVNLLKALDDFVVRKENVISSYGQESLTTVTFTRPAVFTKLTHIE